MSARIEDIERCAFDSVEGNVANALQIIQGRAELRESLSQTDIDEIDARLQASLQQMRGRRLPSARDGQSKEILADFGAKARAKNEQFRIRPLPPFPCN